MRSLLLSLVFCGLALAQNQPSITPSGGTYNGPVTVSVNCFGQAGIYTLDGSNPSVNPYSGSPTGSTQSYGPPVTMTVTTTFKAACVMRGFQGFIVSSPTVGVYTINPNQGGLFTDVYGDNATPANWMFMRGITSGCTATTFCPDRSITRGEVAVFIVRTIASAQVGDPDNFPYTTTPYFTDVPSTHPYFKWIQRLKDLNVTSGCTANTFCPDSTVNNGQIAVFTVKARQMIQYSTVMMPDCTQFAPNLTCDDPNLNLFPNDSGPDYPLFRPWINYLALTQGATSYEQCNVSQSFCTDNPASRGQVAMDIVNGELLGINMAYPVIDKAQMTSSPGTGARLSWFSSNPPTVQITFTSNVWPATMDAGYTGEHSTEVCAGCTGTNSNSPLYFQVDPTQNQLFVRFSYLGGATYDFNYVLPGVPDGTVLGKATFTDTTPGVITTPSARKGPTPIDAAARPRYDNNGMGLNNPAYTFTETEINWRNPKGQAFSVPRGDTVDIGNLSYSHVAANGEYAYTFKLRNHDAMMIHIGHEVAADYTSEGEFVQTRSQQPAGWSVFQGHGWHVLLGKAQENSETAAYTMYSKYLPGLVEVYVQPDVQGFRKLFAQGSGVASAPQSGPIDPDTNRVNTAMMRDALFWANNSRLEFAIGPSIPAGAGRGEVLHHVETWVYEYGFDFLKPLLVPGVDVVKALGSLKPSTQLELDVVASLHEVLN